MKKKKIILILDSDKMYRQKRHQFESIDTKVFVKQLELLGYEVEITNYFDVLNNISNIKNELIVYTASQNKKYKKYIEDIIYSLSLDNFLIPGFESLIGQENKAYQEIQRKKMNLDGLKSYIISDINELRTLNIKFPIVLKKADTCSSIGVFKANDEKQLNKIIKKHFLKRDIRYYILLLKLFAKKILNSKSYKWTEFMLNEYKYTRVILQEFIPDLDGDFKILVYGDKYYALKRGLKPGDFKASGSGIRDINCEPQKEMLNFAKKCFEQLDVPFAGLDISINKNNECNLIEFQSIHIGPVTLIDSNKYYKYENKKWVKYETKSILEKEYANAIDWYIKRKSFERK